MIGRATIVHLVGDGTDTANCHVSLSALAEADLLEGDAATSAKSRRWSESLPFSFSAMRS